MFWRNKCRDFAVNACLRPEARAKLVNALCDAASDVELIDRIRSDLATLRDNVLRRIKVGVLYTAQEFPKYEGAYGYMLSKVLPEGQKALACMLLAFDTTAGYTAAKELVATHERDWAESYLDTLLRRALDLVGDARFSTMEKAVVTNMNQYCEHEYFVRVVFEAMIAGLVLPVHNPRRLTHYLSQFCR